MFTCLPFLQSNVSYFKILLIMYNYHDYIEYNIIKDILLLVLLASVHYLIVGEIQTETKFKCALS